MNNQKTEFGNFCQCAENAPDGTYIDAKEIRELIGQTVDKFMQEARDLGLMAKGDDRAYALECAIYNYLKECNPENDATFIVAEGFGEHVQGIARDRVIANSIRDRDFLASRGLNDQ